jgi:hypothetical protein
MTGCSEHKSEDERHVEATASCGFADGQRWLEQYTEVFDAGVTPYVHIIGKHVASMLKKGGFNFEDMLFEIECDYSKKHPNRCMESYVQQQSLKMIKRNPEIQPAAQKKLLVILDRN